MGKQNSGAIAVVVIIALVVLFVFLKGNSLQTITTPTISTTPGVQYYGFFSQTNFPWYYDTNQYPNLNGRPSQSGVVRILDYEFITEKSDFQSVLACLDSPPTGATPTLVDSDGCQHWTYNSQVVTGRCCTGYPNVCAYCVRDASYVGSCFVDFPITACTTGSLNTDYGGKSKVLDSGWACWGKMTVKKNGTVVSYDDQFTRDRRLVYSDSYVTADLGRQYWFNSNPLGCEMLQSTYLFNLKSSSFLFDVSVPPQQVFQGQNVKVDIKVTNTYGFSEGLVGNLSVTFKVPTTIGDAVKTDSRLVRIMQGDNFYQYNVSTQKVTDLITVTPSLTILVNTSYVSGINLPEPGGSLLRPSETFSYYPIGRYDGSTSNVQINPRPLYIDIPASGCSSFVGYSLNRDGTLCIRDDIMNISCVQLGCPVLVVNNSEVAYTCTSAGVCAQTIYKYGCNSDADCQGIGVCLANAAGQKFCVDKQIVERLIYTNGTVNITGPTFITKKCSDFDFCIDGYVCEDRSINGSLAAFCKQTNVPSSYSNQTTGSSSSGSSSGTFDFGIKNVDFSSPTVIAVIMLVVFGVFLLVGGLRK